VVHWSYSAPTPSNDPLYGLEGVSRSFLISTASAATNAIARRTFGKVDVAIKAVSAWVAVASKVVGCVDGLGNNESVNGVVRRCVMGTRVADGTRFVEMDVNVDLEVDVNLVMVLIGTNADTKSAMVFMSVNSLFAFLASLPFLTGLLVGYGVSKPWIIKHAFGKFTE